MSRLGRTLAWTLLIAGVAGLIWIIPWPQLQILFAGFVLLVVIILAPIAYFSNRASNREMVNSQIRLEHLYGAHWVLANERIDFYDLGNVSPDLRNQPALSGGVLNLPGVSARPNPTPRMAAIEAANPPGAQGADGQSWPTYPRPVANEPSRRRTRDHQPAHAGRKRKSGMIKWLWERFHFRKRVKVLPGWHINLSKKIFSKHPGEGVSNTFGGKALSYNTRRKTWASNTPGPGGLQGKKRR